jgi:putative restriction endonuclease
MPSVFVYSAGQSAARHFERSIRTGIALATFEPLLPPNVYATLEEAYPDGQCYLWGDRGGEHGRQYWGQIRPGDLALCYQRRRIVAASTVVATIENEAAGLAAWPDASAEPYRLLFFLSKPQWVDLPVASLPQYFGKVYQGLRRLPTSDRILQDFGSLDRFVNQGLLADGADDPANALPDTLTAEQILDAARQFDTGRTHRFADSTGYDVIVGSRRYPPKAIVGIAAELMTGNEYRPDDFSGGLGSKCFRLLEQAGYQIVEKDGAEPLREGDKTEAGELLPIFDDTGRPLRATCRIRGMGHDWDVVIESRGGTLGTPSETNADYSAGFALLMSRLAALDAVVTDALLDSKKMRDAAVADSDRRLQAERFPFPIHLHPSVADDVTKALRRAQPNIGSDRRSGAGNSTRRVRLAIGLPRLPANTVSVQDYLSGAKSLGPITAADLAARAEADYFEPTSITDERMKVIAEIVRRQGSPQFRRLMLEAYGGRCAITGCDAEPALEAAHIVAYLGPKTNSVQNGLLLRADLHTLFDRGLLAIDPDTQTVVMHLSLLTTAYSSLAGSAIRLPDRVDWWPSSDALGRHLTACGLARPSNKG